MLVAEKKRPAISAMPLSTRIPNTSQHHNPHPSAQNKTTKPLVNHSDRSWPVTVCSPKGWSFVAPAPQIFINLHATFMLFCVSKTNPRRTRSTSLYKTSALPAGFGKIQNQVYNKLLGPAAAMFEDFTAEPFFGLLIHSQSLCYAARRVKWGHQTSSVPSFQVLSLWDAARAGWMLVRSRKRNLHIQTIPWLMRTEVK